MLHPFRSGNSVIIVATYLPARSKGSMRAKAMPQQLDLFRSASLAPILTAAAASEPALVAQT
jgi:hypothetical protein